MPHPTQLVTGIEALPVVNQDQVGGVEAIVAVNLDEEVSGDLQARLDQRCALFEYFDMGEIGPTVGFMAQACEQITNVHGLLPAKFSGA